MERLRSDDISRYIQGAGPARQKNKVNNSQCKILDCVEGVMLYSCDIPGAEEVF